MVNLFFSEYAEGSSNNKYLEIYNPSSEAVSLADYAFPSVSNAPATVGEYEYWNTFDEGATIPANGVYVIAHPSSDATILAFANMTHYYLSNGDDGYALAYGNENGYEIIDFIGDFNGDPGSGWEVAGISNGTKDHTLVRKCSVESGNTDWIASAGTNADDSEWIVLEQNDWSDLGSHTTPCEDVEVILGCTDETAINYDPAATEDDGSCEYISVETYSLTVSVDMSVEGFAAGDGSTWDDLDGSSMAVRLNGGTWVAMTDMGDNVWSYTFTVEPGEYTYNFNDGFYESGPFGDCAGGNYGNDRLVSVESDNVTVPTVCWESCDACPDIILGCTDESANNYDSSANEDDGSCTYPAPMANLFYAEYAEGSSNNKYFEIYNPSSEAVNLSDYTYNNCSNACDDWEYSTSFAAGAVIEAGGVYTVCHSSFSGDQSLCDETVTLYFNGNDAQGLIYVPTGEVIDVIGSITDYTYWDVAGVSQGTKDHTLVRKCSVESGNTDWVASAGTNADDSEWIVLEQNDWSDLGLHTTPCEDVEVIPGCTDASADNFDPNATEDDGSCTYCSSFEVVLLGTSDASAAGASDGSVQATGTGGSNDLDVSVLDANGESANPFALSAGDYTVVVTDLVSGCEAQTTVTISEPAVAEDPCDIVPSGLFVDNIIHNRVVFNWSAPSAAPSHYMIRYRVVGTSSWTVMTAGPVNSNEFTGTSRTRYFMEPGTTYQWSMRARVLNEDGSTNCQSSWSANSEYTTLPACANLENLSVSTEANWVTFFADAPDASWGVWQSKGKMREAGTNSFRYVNGGSDGSINGLKGNFDASTDYEWHTKAWCTGNVDANGDSDPMYHSGWGDFSSFTTEAPCDKMPTNLTTSSNGANTAVIMSWDTPESGAPDHYFLEMTNLTTGAVYQWNNIPGGDNSKTKFGQNPGDEISWRIRGACGTNGTSWATIFSQPAEYTLGGARLENSALANLDVYPNPSRDIFNVTFTSKEAQTMTVKVVNMIGEEIFTEELTEFVGQYTKVIDMNTQPKGVYFLEITTSTGGINHKIITQ